MALPLKLVLLWLENTGFVGNEEHPAGPNNPALRLLFADHFLEHQAGAFAKTPNQTGVLKVTQVDNMSSVIP